MNPSIPRPSAALVVAMIALFAALAGGAVALPGGGNVDRNDLKRGAVTKKALKKGAVTKRAIKKDAVTAKAIQAGAVGTDKVADAAITAPKIASGEAPHRVGASGEPAFGDGGEGDCVWRNAGASLGISGANPVSFYKDQLGFVHLEGIAVAEDGPGGDGVCDLNDPGETEDGIVFTLPSGYEPNGLVFSGAVFGIVVVTPAGGGTIEGISIAGGSVFGSDVVPMDGVEFRPATAGAATASAAKIDLDALERLGR
jgi:hypothetical protein